jgi:hypothetical protein
MSAFDLLLEKMIKTRKGIIIEVKIFSKDHIDLFV